MNKQPTLILMTKNPVAGEVKTRLLSHVSAKTASAIALEMIIDTIEKATACWQGNIWLLVSPDASHPKLIQLAKQYKLRLRTQSAGDLGTKMESAICEALQHAPAAAVMGCDIPTVTPAILEFANNRLLEGRNVMGPSTDGGFYFAGFTQCQFGMFKDIQWSTSTVFEVTLRRLQACKMPVEVMLPCLNDIDHWSDFVDLAKYQSRYSKFLHKLNSLD